MKLKFNPFSGELQYVTDISFLKLKGTVNTTGDLPLTENEENDLLKKRIELLEQK